jgi:photosystem II stability/assembly factor-like uncharacterized protein
MKNDVDVGRLNPVEISQVEHAMADPVFDELRQAIVETPRDRAEAGSDPTAHLRSPVRPFRRVSIVLAAVAAAMVLVVGLLAVGGNGSNGHTTEPNQPRHPLGGGSQATAASLKMGTWQILDASVKGNWQQNTSGPPTGYLTCPTASICYQMSGEYPSALAGAPLLSESLYASDDAGTTWTAYPMPSGFAPTSPISCGGPRSCSAGGTYGGGSVLVTTQNGGHSFSISPVPQGVGSFVTIDCTAINVCSGLAASRLYIAGHSDATFLSTADGGTMFTDTPIIPGDSMESLSCSSNFDCTAVGTSDAIGVDDWTAGVVARTTDGGRTWTPGSLPAGFGISQYSELSCADARHCSVTGNISIHVPNPPQCSSLPAFAGPTTTTTQPTMPSQAVQAIAKAESRKASAADQQSATSGGGFSCNPSGLTTSGDIASTVDGGRTWTPDPSPSDIAQPNFTSISCPTASECWAAGSAAAANQAGTSHNEGGPILLGTTNGGSSWSPVRFTVPGNAPNYDGQSYLSFGFITCPSVDTCIANGATAQGSPTAPVYTLTQKGAKY